MDEFIKQIINGPKGFHAKEDKLRVGHRNGRDNAIAEFVIKSLSNPYCEGSEEMLMFIRERRDIATI